MRRRGRTTPSAALFTALAVALVVLGTAGADAAPRHPGAAAKVPRGFSVVQYAATSPAPLPWNAHLLSGANPKLTSKGSPHAEVGPGGTVAVAFRNAEGHAMLMSALRATRFHWVDLTKATGSAPMLGDPVPVITRWGEDEAWLVAGSGDLLHVTKQPLRVIRTDGAPNDVPPSRWVAEDVTSEAAGPKVVGAPSVVAVGNQLAVFARTSSGDVIQYVNDGLRGRDWNAYDLSVMSHGPKVAADPVAFFDPVTSQVRVASTELAPSRGHVVVFTPDDVGGLVWSFQDVSFAAGLPVVTAGLAAATTPTGPVLYGAGPTGNLLQFTGTDAAGATTWKLADLTASVPGAPQVSGTPQVATSGAKIAITAVAASWGDLFVWQNTGAKGAFVATDVSVTGAGDARTVAGRPDAVYVGANLYLYGAGVAVPAPQGTGVYAIPWTKWPQAIKDGWPALGVTGGLGTQCAPWTGWSKIGSATPPDQYVGSVIQAGHVRETWLSFWTVSGPRTNPGPGCSAEKGPVTAQTYYQHGYLAGRWIATQIATYRSQGVGLKPDWVIFDPEGFPDNHSGLWGPTAPPSALSKSVGNWYAILSGWRNGLAAIDPSLRPGFYANQYEYMAYRLYNVQMPAFIAGAFAQDVKGAQRTLVVPKRTAFGANILGFVMYNTFTPTCAQVTNESRLLESAPWRGLYNTLQTPAGTYCPPG